jgi:hypothetical protein
LNGRQADGAPAVSNSDAVNGDDQDRRQVISGSLMSPSDVAYMLPHFAKLSINLTSIKSAHKIPANIIARLVSLP